MAPDVATPLERALAVWLEWRGAEPRSTAAELTARHPDLREHLEALMHERVGGEADGERLGDYVLVRELGRGGMGVVYEALDLALERRVALKVLPPGVAGDAHAVARFKREALAVARLDHPGIVKVLGVGHAADPRAGDTWFFAMELMAGGSLASNPPRDPRAQVSLIAAVAEALAHAHAHGILHRDVKPANILLHGDGRPVLTDFGLARQLADPRLTRSGGFLGTPAYASPEQVRGLEVDGRSDVFSLGGVLYELLAGRRPFDGVDVATIMHAVAFAEPRDVRSLAPQLDRNLGAVVHKALEKDVARRYATMAALAGELRAWLAGEPVAARPLGRTARTLRWMRREPWRAAVVAGLALGVPTLAGLVGHQLATAPVLAAGAAQLRRAELDRLLHEGYLALAAQDHVRADERFAAVRVREPRDVEAWVGSMLSLIWSGMAQRVLVETDRGATVVGDVPALARTRVAALRKVGRLEEAAALEQTLGAPDAAIDLFAAGVIDLMAGHDTDDAEMIRRAVRLLRRAVETASVARSSYHFWLLRGAQRSGDRALATDVAAAIARLWPQEWTAAREVADWLIDEDPARAVAQFERLVAEAAPARRASAAYQLGFARERTHDTKGAIAAYREALAADPGHGQAHNNLGVQLAQGGDHEGAIVAYRAALAIDPARAKVHLNLAVSLRACGDADAAEAAYAEAIRLHPSYARAHFNLGNLLAERGATAAAADAFRAAVQSDPTYVRAWSNLAIALRNQGDMTGAIEACRRAIALAPREVPPLINLGACLEDAGEHAGARQAYESAVSLAPSNGFAWRALARCLVAPRLAEAQADPALAVVAARRALALLGKPDRFAQLALADALVRLGNVAEGAAALAEAERMFAAAGGVSADDRECLATARARLEGLGSGR